MRLNVPIPYIAFMGTDAHFLSDLIDKRDAAREQYFAHRHLGNLTPAQETAFKLTNMALLLLLHAAEIELSAELELHALLATEQEAA